MPERPRILLVDDHPLFRDALQSALTSASGLCADTVNADSLDAAVDKLKSQDLDLIMLDLKLPDATGFHGLTKLQSIAPDGRYVIVSATDSAEVIHKAKELGVAGYIPKSLDLPTLCAAVENILQGGEWFPDIETSKNIADEDLAARVASLTPAQRRVLTGLADGLLNKQIAFEMEISIATVKAHMTAIFRKLGANNRTQALLIYKSAMEIEDGNTFA